jgi:hypothetical protein
MDDDLYLTKYEKEVLDEIDLKCGEYLEHIPKRHWRYFVTPVLIRQLAKAREEIEYLKERLKNATQSTRQP